MAAGTKDTDAVNVAQLKSVNLAFKGNVGSGDVNLATNDSDKKLTIQGDRTYITTNAKWEIYLLYLQIKKTLMLRMELQELMQV